MNTKSTNTETESHTPPYQDRITLRKWEAAQTLGVSERTLHTLLSTGAIPSVKIGRVVLIPVAGINAFLDRLRSEG